MKAIIKFLAQWNELLTIPLSLVLFWIGGLFIRAVDPTAGLFDPGIFQIVIWAVAAFLFLHGATWIVIKITFPKLYHFLDEVFENGISESGLLTLYQKCVLALAYFFGCLFAMVLLARAIM